MSEPVFTTRQIDTDRPSYVLQASITGGSGKSMASLLNPSGSGKKLCVRALLIQPRSSSGTNVIVTYETRAITAHSGGSAFTPLKRDSADDASVAQAKTEPSSVTGTTNIHTFILQSNTVQGIYVHRFGSWGERPIVLREGEGICIHQVTSNAGSFDITLIWTEEAP